MRRGAGLTGAGAGGGAARRCATAPLAFDERVLVLGPAFAVDPVNVPIRVSAVGLPDVETRG